VINHDDFLNDLDEFMREELAKDLNIQTDENNNYLINDNATANYFIGLSKKCEDDMQQIQEYVAAEKERLIKNLERYEEEQVSSIKRKQLYYDRALEDYTRRELADSSKKSIKLPNGTLAIKKQQPHYTYEDEIIIKWAAEYYPSLVKTTIPEPKHSIDKKELKKLLIIDNGNAYLNGMEIPGLSVEVLEDNFTVKY
jgi:hypothetical protein